MKTSSWSIANGTGCCGGAWVRAGGALAALLVLLPAYGRPATATPKRKVDQTWARSWCATNANWRGVHLMAHTDADARKLIEQLPDLAAVGANAIVLEVNYSFQFDTHPELRSGSGISKAAARELAAAARSRGMRLIPQFNCLGHQSWSKTTLPLLAKYPELDETPGQYPNNEKIYCRSWCPQHPEVNKIVFALLDEIIDAFEADAFHVGMDEVFLIGSEHCARCRGGDPARLFARAVNDLHQHLVAGRGLEMLMWGDRLLPAKELGYSEWEAAKNGTEGAVDLVPKDIILCDWHYGKQAEYRSVPWLADKGFRVWPAGWQPLEATEAFSAYARRLGNPRVLGYLCTTWGKVGIGQAAEWPPIKNVLPAWRGDSPASGGDKKPNWVLVWQDEFDRDGFLDPAKWVKCERGGSDWDRHMTTNDSCFEVKGGNLILKGINNPDPADPVKVLTGGVTTKGKFNFTYGKVEIRARLGCAKGAWPAFWMLPAKPQEHYGEIDIMEHLNFDDFVYQTVHSHYTLKLGQKANPKSSGKAQHRRGEFNVYGLEWHPDKLVFTIDGVPTLTYPKIQTDKEGQWPFDRPYYLLVDMQLGGKWVGEIDYAQLPVQMEIDSVKVYQDRQ